MYSLASRSLILNVNAYLDRSKTKLTLFSILQKFPVSRIFIQVHNSLPDTVEILLQIVPQERGRKESDGVRASGGRETDGGREEITEGRKQKQRGETIYEKMNKNKCKKHFFLLRILPPPCRFSSIIVNWKEKKVFRHEQRN